jgi:hypothetical protein
VDWHTRHFGEWRSSHLDMFLLVGTTFILALWTNRQSLNRMFKPVNIHDDPFAKASFVIARAVFPWSGRLSNFWEARS